MASNDTGIYIDTANLANYAKNAAALNGRNGTVRGAFAAAEITGALNKIKAVCARRTAETAVHRGTRADEWLLDNWYIAEREGREAVFNLKNSGRLEKNEKSGRAAVCEIASSFAGSGRGEVTEDRLFMFLDAYQDVAVISEKELGIFISALKGELVIFLAEICAAVDEGRGGDDELSLLLENIFTSLRFLAGFDPSHLLGKVNRLEAALRKDPSGIYPLMDDESRESYRRELSRVAKRAGISPVEAARTVVGFCENGPEKHVGHYIFTEPLGMKKRERTGGWYVAFIVLASSFFSMLTGFKLENPFIALLLAFPVSEIVKNVTDFVAVRIVHPKKLPRMSFEGGVPKSGRTVCVISALLSSPEDGEKYGKLIEEYRLANRDAGENLLFGILGDLPEAEKPVMDSDRECINAVTKEIERLNKKYGGGFFFFIRDREYNEKAGCCMGYERKRGAILGLARLLGGEKSRVRCAAGDEKKLEGVNFIITLDSDTRLNAGSAKELIGAAMHPLNVPVVDEKKGCVVRGSGIIQPRVSVELEAANKSDFTRIFAGQGGVDPYGSVVSDVYQDLFGRGSFTGKGIINIPAYLRCMDGAIPENRVLSHDLIEGAYLNCAYMADVELTDGYPYKVLSYYSRMHRWTRGDWQNLVWLARKVKNSRGEKVDNPLGDVDRWKIFDNLRRSLVPVFTVLALVTGMMTSVGAFAAAGAIAAGAVASELLISSVALMLHHDSSAKARYHSTIISGFPGTMMRTVIRLMLLPYEAWVSVTAIVTALHRMLFTGRDMLSWVTASDAEKGTKGSIGNHFKKMAVCVIVGAVIMLFTPNAPAAAVGLVWAFTPAYAYALSREIKENKFLSEIDRQFLLSAGRDMWRYFDELVTEKENYLPPDNFQEQPFSGTAHRTSPTNIGLYMLSALAAADLGITDEETAFLKIEKTLSTIEKLPKWNGHLFNWYDTQTAAPLEPAYVSTVDSGNLAGCLITLRQALKRARREELGERCGQLADGMDFTPLFDKKRMIFYIGWDMGKNAPTEGWYDLLASEARQTSFIAVATGAVPRKHWRRLGRALVSQDNFSGMASWTGTMFEYMMPNLILPCSKNSLIYESVKFCVYAQRRAAGSLPWGVSESGFYAFDQALNYRYKAHGVQRLALKRGMNLDYVVSPYSSFIALGVNTKAAVSNLRRLGGMGMTGKYGYYEAVDFTPSRQRNGSFEIVRQYMAHHVGMSLIAVDNLLMDGVMQKRFMEDVRMSAFRELLEERVPLGEVVLRQPPREVPEKLSGRESGGYEKQFDVLDAFSPSCLPLSNGSYGLLLTEMGKSRSEWNGLELTNFVADVTGGCGMEFYLKTPDGTFSLLPAPLWDKTVEYSGRFTSQIGEISAKKGKYSAKVISLVPPDGAGEKRIVEITCGEDIARECEVICVFEPVLHKASDYRSHPSFSRLSLEAETAEGGIVIKRRDKTGSGGAYMCFMPSAGGRFRTEGERSGKIESASLKKYTPEMRVSCAVKPEFRNGKAEVSFALAPSYERDEAILSARRILEEKNTASISRIEASALMLGLRLKGVKRAVDRITDLVFFTDARRNETAGKCGQQDLWKVGISGDLPIAAAVVHDEDEAVEAVELAKEHAFLTENGVKSDLVLLLTDGSDYRCAQKRTVTDFLHQAGRDSTVGAFGGVHLLDADGEGAEAVKIMANVMVDLGGEKPRIKRRGGMPAFVDSVGQNTGEIGYRFENDGEFSFAMKGALPPVAWENVLTNENYGAVVTEAGTGHMWYKNSRENKVNPWLNDPVTLRGVERLEIIRDGARRSFFADGGSEAQIVRYGAGYAVWEKEVLGVRTKATAFVPPDVNGRVLFIETEGDGGAEVSYFTELSLGRRNEPSRRVATSCEDGVIKAEDLSGEFDGERFFAAASQAPLRFTTDREEWLRGEASGITGTGFPSCIGAVYPCSGELVIVTGCDDAAKLKGLTDTAVCRRKLEETKKYWEKMTRPFTVNTGCRELDDYMNGWALYQTLACRIMARTSVWQNGGAYGFRDQLQDITAIAAFDPERAKKQIIKAAAHQYREGDVMHWWHPMSQGDKGVRTRCSDDLLWLPYALCDYVEKTGDRSICSSRAPYMVSRELAPQEDERYETPEVSKEEDTVLRHAMAAAEQAMFRGVGAHGLCLMGSGDWNDGMDQVGIKGQGESVWLTWFESLVLVKLAKLCRSEGDSRSAKKYEEYALRLRNAADEAWDGGWYLRGWYDDGKPLGSAGSDECAVDSIAQSFAVFAGGDREKCKKALKNAYSKLFDREKRVVKLFTPSFDDGVGQPGYIKRYAPGFRENGGQYTHGAVWLAIAFFEAGMKDKGWEILKALLPGGRNMETYKVEPYVMAADVYSNPDNYGRGGWTWYTGAAGWYHRAVTEHMLGLKVRGGRLYIEPEIPESLGPCQVEFDTGEGVLSIELGEKIKVNGKEYDKAGYAIKINNYFIPNERKM